MIRLIFAALIVAAFSVGLIGCQDRSGDETKMTDSSAKMSDVDAANSIQVILDADDGLKAANLKVDARVDKNIATLSGTVDSESLHSKAIELANSAQTGLRIEDQIEIQPNEVSRNEYTTQLAKEEWAKAKQFGEQVGSRLDDAWIHGKIVAKMVVSAKTLKRTISVDVNNNVVTLRGTVEGPEEKVEVGRIAKETDGVTRVDNQLKVNA